MNFLDYDLNPIKSIMESVAASLLFEYNDEHTRKMFQLMVSRAISDLNVPYETLVICDESNNPKEIIENNKFVAVVVISEGNGGQIRKLNLTVGPNIGNHFLEIN